MDKQRIDEIVGDIYEASMKAKDQGGALELYVLLSSLEKAAGTFKKELLEAAIEERERYDKREQVIRAGMEVSVMQTTRWSYEDPEIDRYKTLIKGRELLAKKSATTGASICDENGVLVEPAIAKTSTTITVKQPR